MTETPEQRARREIDADLTSAGWLVQGRDDLDLTAGRGIAVREFQMKRGFGFADYLLYVERRAIGAVEAKAAGTLTGVEAQSAKYAVGLPTTSPPIDARCRSCSSRTAQSPISPTDRRGFTSCVREPSALRGSFSPCKPGSSSIRCQEPFRVSCTPR